MSFGKCMAGMVLAALMIGCGDAERNSAGENGAGSPDAAVVADSPSTGASAAALPVDSTSSVVLFVGTSLTAGLGVSPGDAYPALIQQRIREADLPYRVVNAGISGETSAGARSRISWVLQQPFDVLVLETGANDMLRGVAPASTEDNIQAIIDAVRDGRPDARIVLAGMLAMPNLGPAYVGEFEAIYPRVAERNGITLIPFLLEGVAGERELNQGDGVHPTPAGHEKIAETVWRVLGPELEEAAASSELP
jgi:acyl-CoA thioesterase-1